VLLVAVGVAVGVAGPAAVVVGVPVGPVKVVVGLPVVVVDWLEHRVVAKARSVLVVDNAESTLRTVANRSFWAVVMEAADPEAACDEPEEPGVPVLLPVPVVVLLSAVPVVVLLLAVPVVAMLSAVPVVLPVLVLVLAASVAAPELDPAEIWPDFACARVSSALATCPWAVAREDFREVVSKVARTWPAVTLSPMATGTVVTTPDTAKDTVAALVGCVVPVACSVWTTGYELTLAVTYAGALSRELA
jgi:hypothetical protein